MRDARTILREAGLFAKKSFGQNFLIAPHAIGAIAKACVEESELGHASVVELGAGLGALTAALLERAGYVVAVERDRDLVPILTRELDASIADGRLSIVEGDAQKVDVAALIGHRDRPRVLCGNLPYQITGRLLQLATEQSESIDRAVFMVQQEVAARLVAAPSSKEYGALTVFVRAAFDVSRVLTVPSGAFHPSPDVTSAVVRLTPLRPRRADETETFRALVRGAFHARRKTLRNAWRDVGAPEIIDRAALLAGVSLDARGETLDVEAFARVARAVDEAATP